MIVASDDASVAFEARIVSDHSTMVARVPSPCIIRSEDCDRGTSSQRHLANVKEMSERKDSAIRAHRRLARDRNGT
jgi:hypothetical protein